MKKADVINLVLSDASKRKKFIENIIREGAEKKRQRLNEALEQGFTSRIDGNKVFIDSKEIAKRLQQSIDFDMSKFSSDFEKEQVKKLFRDLVKIGLVE